MDSSSSGIHCIAWCLCCLGCFTGCNSVIGLGDFSIIDPTLDAGANPSNEDCTVVAGPEHDERALRLGLLAASSGPQKRINAARQASAVLAVDAINAAGGIPFDTGSKEHRPVALVACDATRDVIDAATRLITGLGARAIIGPDESQDGVQLATKLAIPRETLVVNPTATETRLGDLLDDGLQWSMVPDDDLRAPWLREQLRVLEASLRAQRSGVKLAIAVRDDALGQSARELLSKLDFGGKPLTDPANLGVQVRIDAYAPDAANHNPLVDAYLEFAPDIVVVFGMTEAVTQIIAPLEARWGTRQHRAPAPEYVLTDAAKVPELLELVAQNASLGSRIRGIGATYAASAREVNTAFLAAFAPRVDAGLGGVSGLASTFDAVHAIGFAAASAHHFPPTGPELSAALDSMSAGTIADDVRPEHLADSLRRVAAGMPLRVMGALAPLAWDARGARANGALEVWCVAARDGRAEFASSGMRAEVTDQPADPPALSARCPSAEPPADPTSVGVGTPMIDVPPAQPPATPALEPTQPAQMPDAGASQMTMDASAAGAAAPPPASDASPKVPCGGNACDPVQKQLCCVSTLRGLTEDPQPGDFSCKPDASSCALALACASDSDCATGEVCCGITNLTQCVAPEMCSSRAGTHLACDSAASCGPGQLCCAHLAPAAVSYAAISCEATCGPENQGILLCASDADCAATLVTPRCAPSRVIPNLKLCGLPGPQ